MTPIVCRKFTECCTSWLPVMPWKWRQYAFRSRSWTFARLHGITLQKTVLFLLDFKLSLRSECCFFWVIARVLNFICRRLGTLFHLHRRIGVEFYTYPSIKMEQSVPKRRHIKFRRRGITQKKAYSIILICSSVHNWFTCRSNYSVISHNWFTCRSNYSVISHNWFTCRSNYSVISQVWLIIHLVDYQQPCDKNSMQFI